MIRVSNRNLNDTMALDFSIYCKGSISLSRWLCSRSRDAILERVTQREQRAGLDTDVNAIS